MQENANIPAFLGKLWRMVNDPSTDHLICWSPAGNTFIIQNQAQFWYELLPLYYKHNNMSSFVRQLNMYGFHKISSLENAGLLMNSDKDDLQAIQFYHPYFQKDEPEKLKNIKRKTNRSHETQGGVRNDDLTKVLSDVKQLRGRQSSVDSQLTAMKQENAVLWRELAMLRHKHVKQQQIVNKLIEFLLSMVGSSPTTRMPVGVKRRMPLMLHESPSKRSRTRKTGRQHHEGGPTIHELETEEVTPVQLLEEVSAIDDNLPLVQSPITPGSQVNPDSPSQQCADLTPTPAPSKALQNDLTTQPQSLRGANFWDKPEFVNIGDVLTYEGSDNEEDLINTLQKNAQNAEKVFLNPSSRDTLIGNLVGSNAFPINALNDGKTNGKKQTNDKMITTTSSTDPSSKAQAAVKAAEPVQINSGTSCTNDCFREDLDMHLDHTQSELEQLKDILNGCNSFDTSTLLGLFCDNEADFAAKDVQNKENASAIQEPNNLTSDVTDNCAEGLIDFNELFDDELSRDESLVVEPLDGSGVMDAPLHTPSMVKPEPEYPRAI